MPKRVAYIIGWSKTQVLSSNFTLPLKLFVCKLSTSSSSSSYSQFDSKVLTADNTSFRFRHNLIQQIGGKRNEFKRKNKSKSQLSWFKRFQQYIDNIMGWWLFWKHHCPFFLFICFLQIIFEFKYMSSIFVSKQICVFF